ncbi:MAG: hypothetical protein IPM34_04580 [Saprospiraceae bacterium]|nr:hypothetical protein [Saprospiraceae bacterium]
MKKLIYAFCLMFIISSCGNVQKMIDRGDYDQAIDYAVNKLSGNKKRDKEMVLALEYAFKKAQEKDLAMERTLKSQDDDEKWSRIYIIHERIENRQRKIEPFVPLEAEDGYRASFHFVNIQELKKESKKNTADFLYQSALLLIDESQRNFDKSAAREAYQQLEQIDPLFGTYKDKEALKKQAKSLGMNHYLVRIKNNTQSIIPEPVEREMLSIGLEKLNSTWKSYDVKSDPSVRYDYYIQLELNHLEFSPEREKSRVYEDVNEIITEEPLKDKFGKVVKDSTGKVVKEKIKTRYVAVVEEITQQKAVQLGGRMLYSNVRSGDIEISKPLEVEGLFENKYVRINKGNIDYVSDECKKSLKGKALPFPTNEELLLSAAEKIKRQLKSHIDSSNL